MTTDRPPKQPPPVPPSSSSPPPDIPLAPDADERMWAIFSHVSYFVLGIIGPLIIMLCHESFLKRKSAFVYHHARQALAYQIAVAVLVLLATAVTMITCGIGFPLILAVAFGGMVFPILACMAASRNEWYIYPIVDAFL